MTSVVVTAIFHPAPEATEALLAAMRHTIPLVHDEEGCQLYCIQVQPDGVIVMIEKWDSAELLQKHADGQVVADFNAAIAGLMTEPVAVTTLAAIPIGDPVKGAL
jgi:quinol monooxygenase YgiN